MNSRAHSPAGGKAAVLGPVSAPREVRASFVLWLAAVAAGVFETILAIIEAVSGHSALGTGDVIIGVSMRLLIFTVVVYVASAISTFYVRRTQNRGGEPMLWRKWLKWLVVVDTDRQMVLAQEACSGPYNGSAMLRPLVDAAHAVSPLGVVLADAEFDSEHNHRHVRDRLAAASVIPAKRGKATWQVQGYRAKMRAAFPRQLYRMRALVESVFSAIKRKLSARAPGRSLEMQRMQALVLGLAYNLYRLRPCLI